MLSVIRCFQMQSFKIIKKKKAVFRSMCTLYYFQPHQCVSYLKKLCCLVIFRRKNEPKHFQPMIPVLLPGQSFLSHRNYGGRIHECLLGICHGSEFTPREGWVLPPVQDELCRAPSTAGKVGPRETSKFLFSNPDVCFWTRTSLPFPVLTRNDRQGVRRDQQGAQLKSVFWRPLTMGSAEAVLSLHPQRVHQSKRKDSAMGLQMSSWVQKYKLMQGLAGSKSSKICVLCLKCKDELRKTHFFHSFLLGYGSKPAIA